MCCACWRLSEVGTRDAEDHARARQATPGVYQKHAARWNTLRSADVGECVWVERFLSHIPPGGRVLDLGCGTGWPVSERVIAAGFEVVGLDSSPGMIAVARRNFPEAEWVVADIRDLPELGRFDGVMSWDGWFHLSVEEQRAALPRVAEMVKPGGALMLTVGPEEGEVLGYIDGDAVYHASLSPGEYVATLRRCGFGMVEHLRFVEREARGRYVLMAWEKSGRGCTSSTFWGEVAGREAD